MKLRNSYPVTVISVISSRTWRSRKHFLAAFAMAAIGFLLEANSASLAKVYDEPSDRICSGHSCVAKFAIGPHEFGVMTISGKQRSYFGNENEPICSGRILLFLATDSNIAQIKFEFWIFQDGDEINTGENAIFHAPFDFYSWPVDKGGEKVFTIDIQNAGKYVGVLKYESEKGGLSIGKFAFAVSKCH